MNTNLAQELLERHTVAINVAVEDGSCFMVSEQDALDAIRAALSHATSIDVQVGCKAAFKEFDEHQAMVSRIEGAPPMTDTEQARELLAAEYDKAGEKVFASRARSGRYDNDPDMRAIAAALRTSPDGSMSLLREVCEQLDAVGCGACIGSYAPMEDLHGRITAYLAPGAALSTVTTPRDLRTKLGE